MGPARIGAVITVAMLGAGCDVWPFGPSKSVAGTWRAPDCTMGSCAYELSLTENGERVSGAACVDYFGFVPPVRDMAVSGTYPTFDSPTI